MPLNEFDALLQGDKPAQGNEYDALLGEQQDAQKRALAGAQAQAATTTPDRAAKVIELSKRANLPKNVVERNYDEIARRYDGNDYDQLLQQNPALAKWLADGENAAIAADDVAHLSKLDKMIGALQRGGHALLQGASGTILGANARGVNNINYIESLLAAGVDEATAAAQIPDITDIYGVRYMTPQERADLKARLQGAISTSAENVALRQGKIAAIPQDPTIAAALASKSFSDFWYYFSQKPVEFIMTVGAESLPQMAPGIAMAIPSGLAGGTRAAASALGAGSFGVDYAAETLQALAAEGVDLKDPESIKRAVADKELMRRVGQAAFSHAAPVAALDTASGGLAGLKLVPSKLALSGVKREALNLAAQAPAQGVLGAAGEAAGGIAQGKPDLDAGQIMAEFFGEFAGAPVEVATMSAGQAREMYRQRLRAQERKAFFTALGEGVSESKLFQRLPEKLQEFVEAATKDGPISEVYIPVDSWIEYWQGRDVDPKDMAREVLGDASAYDTARKTGDLAIPIGTYATKIAPTPHNAFFTNELRLAPDDMNARESEAFAEDMRKQHEQQQQAQQKAQAEDIHAEAQAKVTADVEAKLIAAGVEPATAKAYAATHGAAFRSIAERSGMDPAALYERYGLQITRAGLPQEGEVSMQQDAVTQDTLSGFANEVLRRNNLSMLSLKKLDGNNVRLSLIEVPEQERGRGRGSAALREIVEFADEKSMRLIVTPESGAGERLNEFYSRVGFKPSAENDVGEVQMVREPTIRVRQPTGSQEPSAIEPFPDYAAAFEEATRLRTGLIPTVTVDGVVRPTMNSLGQPIASSLKAIEAFWRWFGDSKVVDREGRPIVAYHGTSEDFQQFETFPENEIGSWFTTPAASLGKNGLAQARAAAESFAYTQVDLVGGSDIVVSVYLSIKNPIEFESYHDFHTWSRGSVEGNKLRAKLENGEHDGVVIRDSDTDEGYVRDDWVAIEPTQIKSAIGNRGTFDPLSGSILEQPAYHGSPHLFDRFTTDHIGTGEGAQAYGWGLYFAENPGVAEDYKLRLAGEAPITNFSIGGREVVRKEKYLDYGPHVGGPTWPGMKSSPDDVANVWGTLVENLLIDEAGLRAAASNGEINKHVLGELDDLIGRYADDWPEGVAAAKELYARLQRRRREIEIEIADAPGALYEVDIPDRVTEKMLDWDAPLADQPEAVKEAVRNRLKELQYLRPGDNGPRVLTSAWKAYINEHGGMSSTDSGEQVYGLFVIDSGDHAEAQKAASLTLMAKGVPGLKYFDRGSRDKNRGTRNLVVFDESVVKITKINGKEVTQKQIEELRQNDGAETPRGRIRFGQDRKFTIDLLENADLSTFLHESGHFWLEVLGDIADELAIVPAEKLNERQARVREDYAALLKWFGVADRSEIGVDQHEQFARAIEAYFMEGRAPSEGMRAIFARFRAWMLSVYRSLRQLNVSLTPEVRGVFDRMFASDQEIDAAQNEALIEPLFTDAAKAGMSESEFKAYRDRLVTASQRARDELQAKLMRTLQREREQWWKAERAKMRAEVAAEVYARREYIALSVLQSDEMPDGSALPYDLQRVKLDRKVLDDLYGEDFYKSLPRGTTDRGGLHPQQVAELLGYASADELVGDLKGVRPMRSVIEEATDARMREAHGDILVDGTIIDEARAAVQNTDRIKVIQAELRALAKLQRQAAAAVAAERGQAAQDRAQGVRTVSAAVPPLAAIQNMAAGRIAQQRVRDLKPSVYLSAARRAMRDAVKAAASGDYWLALALKQRELLNVELFREATKVSDEVDSAVDYLQSFGEDKRRARIAKAGQDYLDQIDGFLDRYDFARVPLKTLERRKNLLAWIAEKERAGEPVNLPADVEVERRINYKDVTVEELRGVRDSVKHIEHLARLKNRLLTAKKNADLAAVVAEVSESIKAHAKGEAKRSIETRLPGDAATRFIDGWFGSHRKIASIAREMDGHADGGLVWEYVVRPLNAAADREATMNRQATQALAKLFSVYKGKEMRDLYRKTKVDAIGKSLTKMARLVVALNWGNDDNRQKIMDGHGWNEAQVRAILDTLDERDWQFVQGVWDFIGSYWPLIEAKEKRVNGIAPERVQASPVMTRFGEFAGGYYPLRYDDRQSPKAQRDLVKETAAMMMKAGYGRTTTRRGHTKERVEGVKEPVRLDLGVIFEHVTQVIHDLSHHETLLDVNRVVNAKAVSSAIIDHYGNATLDQFTDAIEDIAAGDVLAQKTVERAVNWVRQGVSIAAMGWNLMTSLLQPLGLSQSIVRIGPKWVGRGLSRWLRDTASMENSAAWIRSKSEFMANRMNTQMREMNEIRNQVGLSRGTLTGWVDSAMSTATLGHVDKQAVVDSYFWLIVKAQQIADIPTWLGQYEKSLAAGEEEARAVELADQAVLDSQGGGQLKDLASIQRGGPMLKLWTNFYSYFNVTYNLMAERAKRTHYTKPGEVARLAVDFLLLYTVPATLGFMIKQSLTGKDEDDDELRKKLLAENLLYLLGSMVLMREMSSVVSGYADYQGPAGAGFFAAVGKLVKQSQQGEADAAFWRALNQAAGILFHYPAGQVKRSTEGFAAMMEGETSNPMALLVGPPKE